MKILVINGCLREIESRSWKLASSLLSQANPSAEIKILHLNQMKLKPLTGEKLSKRISKAKRGEMNSKKFELAYELANADKVILAAPFWNHAFPAVISAYFDHALIADIAFKMTPEGYKGLCKGSDFIYVTTRGGIYEENSPLEMATPLLKSYCQILGNFTFHLVVAQGLDIMGADVNAIMNEASETALNLGKTILG